MDFLLHQHFMRGSSSSTSLLSAALALSISFLSPFRVLPSLESSDFCAFFSSSMSSPASLAWSWCFNFRAERNRVDSGRVRRWYEVPKAGTREIPSPYYPQMLVEWPKQSRRIYAPLSTFDISEKRVDPPVFDDLERDTG
jgi:hypothetical protein